MNTPTPPRNDDALTPEERELAALYRQLPQAGPDRALDDAILAHAARAVHAERAPRRRGPSRWMFGAGTAAVLVLAAGLAWRLHQPGVPGPNGQRPANPMAGATTSTAQPAAAAPPVFAPRIAPPPAPPAPPPPLQPPRSALNAKVVSSNAMPAPPPAPPSPPPPPRLLAHPQPPPPAAEHSASPIAALPAPPAPPPPVQEISTNAVVQPLLQGESKAIAAGTAGLPASSTSSAPPPATPEAEIQRIRDLLRAGHRKKAVATLRAFQHAHPDYPLPPNLKALLGDGR